MSEPPKRVWLLQNRSTGFWDEAEQRDEEKGAHQFVLATDHARLVEALAVAREALREATEDCIDLRQSSEFARGWNHGRFRMRQSAHAALARIDTLQQPDQAVPFRVSYP